MATVYLAEDLRHDRKVAIRVLRPELSAVICRLAPRVGQGDGDRAGDLILRRPRVHQHFVKIAALSWSGVRTANQANANSVLLPDASRPDPS